MKPRLVHTIHWMLLIPGILLLLNRQTTSFVTGCRLAANNTMFNCSRAKLSLFPSYINITEITHNIDFSYNSITYIFEIKLSYPSSVTCLNLSHNSIKTIHHNAFKNLTNMLFLDLSYNQLNAGALLEKSTRFEMSEFHSLKWLSFRGNHLGNIERLTFTSHGYHNLEFLDLSHCGIQTLQHLSLQALPRLKILNLQYNIITTFDPDSFSTLMELKELHLEFNRIKVIDDFPLWTDLKSLYLDHNRIQLIKDNAFRHLTSLENLILSYNNLRYITPHSLPNKVTTVKLDGNPWRCDCNMRWIRVSEDIALFQNNSLICTYPSRIRGKNIMDLEAGDLKCLTSAIGVLVAVLLTLTSMILIASILTLIYKKRKSCHCRKDQSGEYIAVFTQDDGLEPQVSISDEKTLVKEVEIYA